MTTALVAALLIGLTCAVIATHTPVDHATFDAPDMPTANALTDAIKEHIDNGGNLGDIVAYAAAAHPSGGVHVALILAGDAEAEATRILRGASDA